MRTGHRFLAATAAAAVLSWWAPGMTAVAIVTAVLGITAYVRTRHTSDAN